MEQKLSDQHVETLKSLPKVLGQIHEQLDKRIVGQDRLIDQLLMTIFCRGHCLLIGVH